jgi:hypothetical protein
MPSVIEESSKNLLFHLKEHSAKLFCSKLHCRYVEYSTHLCCQCNDINKFLMKQK